MAQAQTPLWLWSLLSSTTAAQLEVLALLAALHPMILMLLLAALIQP
jgi:hypothetical protein